MAEKMNAPAAKAGQPQMKLAIVNQKGGSGKSTTAVLLAKAFAAQGRAAVLVDCDPQGGSTALFQAHASPGLFDFLSQQVTDASIAQPVAGIEGLRIVGADYRLDALFVSVDPFALEELGGLFPDSALIFDTAPTLQGLTRAAIIASDRVLIPSEISETAFGPTAYTCQTVAKLKKKPEVILSGYKPSRELAGTKRTLAARFEQALGGAIVGTIPRNLSAAKAATAAGKWTGKTQELIGQPLLAITGGKP